jgi:tocopherol cyclase
MYQGMDRMKGYFEGWYYKFSDKREQNIWAFIPGVSFDRDGSNSHAFIQFLSNSGDLSDYFCYGIDQFSYSSDKPEIKIGQSIFSPKGINVDIRNQSRSITGTLRFRGIKPWPVTIISPGAMGWYAFVPFMECYHGVLSFDHIVDGELKLNGTTVDFNGGRGYIEKDWGRSFPRYHVWIQSNHFKKAGTSLVASVANIPWLGKSFDGFLIGLLDGDHLYKFTTYTGARISNFQYINKRLNLHVQSRHHRLEIEVVYEKGAELMTPVLGDMRGRLSESLGAETKVKLYRKSKSADTLIFDDTGRHTGLEIEGQLPTKLDKNRW